MIVAGQMRDFSQTELVIGVGGRAVFSVAAIDSIL